MNKLTEATKSNEVVGASSILMGPTRIIGRYVRYQKTDLEFAIVFIKGLRYTFKEVKSKKTVVFDTLSQPLHGELTEIVKGTEVYYLHVSDDAVLLRLISIEFCCLDRDGEVLIPTDSIFIGFMHEVRKVADAVYQKFQHNPKMYQLEAAKRNVLNYLEELALKTDQEITELKRHKILKDIEKQLEFAVDETNVYFGRSTSLNAEVYSNTEEFSEVELRIVSSNPTEGEIEYKSLKFFTEQNDNGVYELGIKEVKKKVNDVEKLVGRVRKRSLLSQAKPFYRGRENSDIYAFLNKHIL